jgi:Fe-S-cluster containining protein
MIGPDNWCVHFDHKNRKCGQYETRPVFCQVNPTTYKTMFNIEEEDFSEFCNFCCREQITDVYGENSQEMTQFNSVASDIELADSEMVDAGDYAIDDDGDDDDGEEEEDEENLNK